VELHGGEVGVESSGDEGAGSMFYFALRFSKQASLNPTPQQQAVLILTRQPESSEPIGRVCSGRVCGAAAGLADGEIPDWLSQLLISPPGESCSTSHWPPNWLGAAQGAEGNRIPPVFRAGFTRWMVPTAAARCWRSIT